MPPAMHPIQAYALTESSSAYDPCPEAKEEKMNEHPHQPTRIEAIASGAMAGAIAANSMTLVRMSARRAGWIEKTVPQLMEEMLIEKLHLPVPRGHVAHHALDQLLHIGYGSMLGAIDGVFFHRMRPFTFRRGVAIGVATWAGGAFVLMPLLGAGRSASKASLKENAINLASHLLFGLGSALIAEEIFSQIQRGPTGTQDREATRVG